MVRHNNEVPNRHFHKDWQVRVKTWFNQPARKQRRRNTRGYKAEEIAPAPVAGLLRPIVRGQTRKYNMKVRAGRGFTLAELKLAGIAPKVAATYGISVDHRRRNRSQEGQQLNVARLKAYKQSLIVFPTKRALSRGAELTDDMKTAEQEASDEAFTNNFTITQKVKEDKPRAITDEDKAVGAYAKLRVERSNARHRGMRIERAKEEVRKAAEKAKKKAKGK